MIFETKNMRACQEDYALDRLVLHATGFLFNCVSPILEETTSKRDFEIGPMFNTQDHMIPNFICTMR